LGLWRVRRKIKPGDVANQSQEMGRGEVDMSGSMRKSPFQGTISFLTLLTSTPKMKAVCSSETLQDSQIITRRTNPEDYHLFLKMGIG
jgi:hypothetical protein